jgi:hypothetical protein
VLKGKKLDDIIAIKEKPQTSAVQEMLLAMSELLVSMYLITGKLF